MSVLEQSREYRRLTTLFGEPFAERSREEKNEERKARRRQLKDELYEVGNGFRETGAKIARADNEIPDEDTKQGEEEKLLGAFEEEDTNVEDIHETGVVDDKERSEASGEVLEDEESDGGVSVVYSYSRSEVNLQSDAIDSVDLGGFDAWGYWRSRL